MDVEDVLGQMLDAVFWSLLPATTCGVVAFFALDRWTGDALAGGAALAAFAGGLWLTSRWRGSWGSGLGHGAFWPIW